MKQSKPFLLLNCVSSSFVSIWSLRGTVLKQYNFLYHLFSKHVKCIVYEIIWFLEALSNNLIALCPSSHPLFQLDHFLIICFPFLITCILPLPFNPPTQRPSFHTTLHSMDILSCKLMYESLELETMVECENVPFFVFLSLH